MKWRSLWTWLLLASVVAAGLPACSTTAEQNNAVVAGGYVYPDTGWQRIDRPESVGWSRTGLDSVRAKLQTLNTTAMMAIVGGRVLFDYGDLQRISYLASVRKSLLSMLYGIYQERGKVDLDKTLAELGIDDVEGLTDAEKRAKVRDLITARSGVYHPASNAGDDLASAPPRGSQEPGAYYLYSNWDFNALGTIFEQMTGVNLYDAFERDIAIPIGMRNWDRSIHRKSGNMTRSKHPAYHFHLSTPDMARVGYLMLREGNWNGKQIVPRAWVHESTRAFTPRTEMNPERHRSGVFGYGYLWWVFDSPTLPPEYEGAYTGLGAVGQQILIMPKLDLVIVHKTDPADQKGSVTHSQFLDVVSHVVRARCNAGVYAC
jgi:CubicO group peptidase (beta-lactamase class C family)